MNIELKLKTYEELQFEIMNLTTNIFLKNKEIERLNNIINGMEDFFKYAYDEEVKPLNDRKISVWTICLDKLKELKDSD